ncbi:MAG: hypothetical protein Tsb0016_17990 [Sphingomonadales bacterium]
MSAFDVAVLGILAISAAFAFWRGFTTEALSLGSWAGAVALTLFGFPWTSAWVGKLLSPEWLADFAALIATFIISFFILRWIADKIGDRVRESSLGPVDRMFGAIFGMIRGLIVISAVYLLFDYFVRPKTDPDWIATAKTGAMVQYTAQWMHRFAERGDTTPDIDNLTRRARQLLPNLGDTGAASQPRQNEPAYGDEQRAWLDGLLQRLEDKAAPNGDTTQGDEK